jgi:hypothetical protein
MLLKWVKLLKIGAMKAMLFIMAQRKFCLYFLDVSADLAKIRHRKLAQNIVNGCEISLLILGIKIKFYS